MASTEARPRLSGFSPAVLLIGQLSAGTETVPWPVVVFPGAAGPNQGSKWGTQRPQPDTLQRHQGEAVPAGHRDAARRRTQLGQRHVRDQDTVVDVQHGQCVAAGIPHYYPLNTLNTTARG
ncbi:hypothetical protein ACFXPM_23470 [Streptomyces sp. NPDC059095]|uniref:hypothetical protein n=1 Tax=unclassified Streptomyces TaxID=2593676 RepID=UPI0035D7647E